MGRRSWSSIVTNGIDKVPTTQPASGNRRAIPMAEGATVRVCSIRMSPARA
jgi:hypothetical protein